MHTTTLLDERTFCVICYLQEKVLFQGKHRYLYKGCAIQNFMLRKINNGTNFENESTILQAAKQRGKNDKFYN